MEIKSTASVNFNFILKLTEDEGKALERICQYSTKDFCKIFNEQMGKLDEQQTKGLQSLFSTVRSELPKHLERAEKARDVFRITE